MLRKTFGIMSLALIFAACGDKTKGTGEDTDETGKTEEVLTCNEDGMSPCVIDGRIWCEFIGGSAKVMTWWIEATVDDPQGNHTIKRFPNDVYAYTKQGEQELMKYEGLVCAEGECIGSFREEDYGLLCDQPDQYIFKAVVYDDDENASLPYTLPYQE